MNKLFIGLLCLPLLGCVAPDKIKHIEAGYKISDVAYKTTGNAGIALAAGVGAGAAKEAYDATGRGNVEFGDFVATAAGAVAWQAVHCIRHEPNKICAAVKRAER